MTIPILAAILVIVQASLVTLFVMKQGFKTLGPASVSVYEFADAITCCKFIKVLGLVFGE